MIRTIESLLIILVENLVTKGIDFEELINGSLKNELEKS